MGKWDKNITRGDGEYPPIVTLFDRRKHVSLLPDDGNLTNHIIVQPAKTQQTLLDDVRRMSTVAAEDEGLSASASSIVPEKFLPSVVPELPKGSFVRKWLMAQGDADGDEALRLPEVPNLDPTSSQPMGFRLPEPADQDRHSSSDSDSSDAVLTDEKRGVPKPPKSETDDAFVVSESTPVFPFASDPQNEPSDSLPLASASSSQTSNSSSSTSNESTSNSSSSAGEKDEAEMIKHHEAVMKLFDAGDRSALNIAGMNMNAKQVDAFYFIKKSSSNSAHVHLKCSFSALLSDLKGFVKTPVAVGATLRCHIVRNKAGMDRTLYPTYFLYLEQDSNRLNRILLLTARKRKKSVTSNYLIGLDPSDLGRRSNSFVGKVRGNLIGTEFTIYDSGNSPKRFNYTSLGIDIFNYRQELGAVIYESNVFGFKGPRQMKLIIPSMLGESERFECRPDVEEETILEITKKQRHLPQTLVELRNKPPSWSADTQSYVLNFQGRVLLPSVKNFQIIHPQEPEYVLLQFGRIDEDNFTLDFRYPLCPLQAFGVALTSFDSKLACE